jgi:hypothetical protein
MKKIVEHIMYTLAVSAILLPCAYFFLVELSNKGASL